MVVLPVVDLVVAVPYPDLLHPDVSRYVSLGLSRLSRPRRPCLLSLRRIPRGNIVEESEPWGWQV